MKKEPLDIRLNCQPHYVALARLVSYGSMSEIVFWDEYNTLCREHGQEKVSAAVSEILVVDKTTAPALVRVTPEARKLCWQLLGPPPEHPEYERYWKGRTKPVAHQPPPLLSADEAAKIAVGAIDNPPEDEPAAEPERTKVEEQPEEPTRSATSGLSPEAYTRSAKEKNKRSLFCMLRDARKKLAHHGRRSFMGKEAKKEVATAEAEIRNRGYAVPAEGEETREWDRKKTG